MSRNIRMLAVALSLAGIGLPPGAQAQNTSAIPMGTFSGAASGSLPNGVNWTVNDPRGYWHPLQGYIQHPEWGPQIWTFDPAATLRFGIAGLNGAGECVRIPLEAEVELISTFHSWNVATRLLCIQVSSQSATSIFVINEPRAQLVFEMVGTTGFGRGPVFIEATVPLPTADLSLQKSVDPAAAPAGGAVTYTLVVSNNGPDPADGAVVTDPGATELDCTSLSCSASGGAVCPGASSPAQLATGLLIPTLPVGSSVTLTLGCTLTAGP